MTEICGFLKNWFDRKPDGTEWPKHKGVVFISGNEITVDGEVVPIKEGQYFRIVGSALNDGVYCKNESLSVRDEVFEGAIWEMGVPADVVQIAAEKAEWQSKYNVDSAAYSPYNSESFGGYSYSKNGGEGSSWISVFGPRLMRYKKL